MPLDVPDEQRKRQKWLKSLDLMVKPLDAVFEAKEIQCPLPPYAPPFRLCCAER